MRVFDMTDSAKAVAMLMNQPVILLVFDQTLNPETNWAEENLKAAPWLYALSREDSVQSETLMQAMADGFAIVACETVEEQQHYFNRTRGDSPCPHNSYRGPAKIYAVTLNARGEVQNTNT